MSSSIEKPISKGDTMSPDWELFKRKPLTNQPGGSHVGTATADTKRDAERLAEQVIGVTDADLKRPQVTPPGKPERKRRDW